MPSTDLRRLNQDDYQKIEYGIRRFEIYDTIDEMNDDGCKFYCTMGIDKDEDRLKDKSNNVDLTIVSPGAVIQSPGVFGSVVFLKYSYVILPSYIQNDILSQDSFQVFFTTEVDFRPGIVIDVGSTLYSDGINYGFRVDVNVDSVVVIANDGELRRFEFYHQFDFRLPHRIMIYRYFDTFSVSVDGENLASYKILDIGNIIFNSGTIGYISYSEYESRNVHTGDIEEVAMFSPPMSEGNIKKYFSDNTPFVKRGGNELIEYENIPVSLSYDLTYNKPTRLITSNFFGAEFKKIYTVDKYNNIEELTVENGKIDKENRSFIISNGFKIDNVSTLNEDNSGIEFVVGDKIPAITKLTSDTHVPIKIYMKFKIPDFWDKKNTYNIKLVLRPLSKMLRYSYERLKTEHL
jgi:hypothetical protein